MRTNTLKIYVLLWVLSLSLLSCIEPFAIETESFESALVIEATITNENKFQQIKLSRTYAIDSDGPNPESNAQVEIVDESGNTYNFFEFQPGLYQSSSVFSAVKDVNYVLRIITADGRDYSSDPAKFTGISEITSLSARAYSNDGVQGVGVFIDSEDPSGNSRYYRYTYEETYKIVAPKYSPLEFVISVDPLGNCSLDLEPRAEQKRDCFASVPSKSIILTATANLTQDVVSNFQVKFLSKDNPIIANRYSTFINQYSQSQDAYNFYETLKNFSGSGSIFSQTQPGFFEGNVFSEIDEKEKVVGFFDVSSVVSQRVYFNYRDFYDDIPPYFIGCNQYAPDPTAIKDEIDSKRGLFFTTLIDPDTNLEKTFLVPFPCGDCTVYGSNVEPDFWID